MTVQMRQVETVLLNKLKSERDEAMTPINVLINYTYRELLTSMDRLKVTGDQVHFKFGTLNSDIFSWNVIKMKA